MNALLVIDLQKEFKDDCGQYEKVLQFIREHKADYDYVLGTIFKNFPDSMYVKHLGYTDCMYNINAVIDNIFPKIPRPELGYEYDELIIKSGYSLDANDIVENLCHIAQKRGEGHMPHLHFDIVGCDADACILATAFTLWDRGNDFRILSDYIYTTAKDITKEDALKIMRRNFGDCVV